MRDDDDEWDAFLKILAYSYKLHHCHQTAQAVKLYNLINILLNSGWGRKPILLFLANLAGEVQDESMKVSQKYIFFYFSVLETVETDRLRCISFIACYTLSKLDIILRISIRRLKCDSSCTY
jgi:hypothetical protein